MGKSQQMMFIDMGSDIKVSLSFECGLCNFYFCARSRTCRVELFLQLRNSGPSDFHPSPGIPPFEPALFRMRGQPSWGRRSM